MASARRGFTSPAYSLPDISMKEAELGRCKAGKEKKIGRMGWNAMK
jgi:hypothetical protein